MMRDQLCNSGWNNPLDCEIHDLERSELQNQQQDHQRPQEMPEAWSPRESETERCETSEEAVVVIASRFIMPVHCVSLSSGQARSCSITSGG
jgi:hypothetical protein